MACLNMFNSEQQGIYSSSMDPRISFSSDFVDSKDEAIKYIEAPVSSDFEFCARKYKMIPADEIFCKGMILPLKDNCTNKLRKITLRDELLVEDDDFGASPRVHHKSSGWWKERLGLKGSTTHPVVSNKNGLEEKTASVFMHEGLDAKNIGLFE